MIEILLGALAEAIFAQIVEDLAQRPGLVALRDKLKGISPEMLAFQRALTVTYVEFSQRYPALSASLFDEHFLQNPVTVRELVKLLTPDQSPSESTLAQLWQNQFRNSPSVDLLEPVSYFLSTLIEEIKAQPILRPFVDSRAFDKLYVIAQRNQEQTEIQKQIEAILVDIRNLLAINPNRSNSPALYHTAAGPDTRATAQEALIDFLLTVSAFHNRGNRDALLFRLESLGTTIPRSEVPVADIVGMVSSLAALGQLETGEWPLDILARNAQRFCPPNTDSGRQLEQILVRLSNL